VVFDQIDEKDDELFGENSGASLVEKLLQRYTILKVDHICELLGR